MNSNWTAHGSTNWWSESEPECESVRVTSAPLGWWSAWWGHQARLQQGLFFAQVNPGSLPRFMYGLLYGTSMTGRLADSEGVDKYSSTMEDMGQWTSLWIARGLVESICSDSCHPPLMDFDDRERRFWSMSNSKPSHIWVPKFDPYSHMGIYIIIFIIYLHILDVCVITLDDVCFLCKMVAFGFGFCWPLNGTTKRRVKPGWKGNEVFRNAKKWNAEFFYQLVFSKPTVNQQLNW